MAFDYKKEYKEFYLPKKKPVLITVPAMNFVSVRGKGNPNEEGGAYSNPSACFTELPLRLK